MPTRLLLPLAVLILLAPLAHAGEEVFVLDNGSVFRGRVVEQAPDTLSVKLTGFARDAVVSLERSRIVTRFVPVASPNPDLEPRTSGEDWTASTRTPGDEMPGTGPAMPPEVALATRPPLPEPEPGLHQEDFFNRMGRVTVRALPSSDGGRLALGALVLLLIVGLLLLGGRLVEIETMTPALAVLLGALLVGAVALDLLFQASLLRADRAPWILPLQGILWAGAATSTLRTSFARVFLLFAFVAFTVAVLGFATGAVLIAL